MISPPEAPPIDSECAFEQVLQIASRLAAAGIRHSVVCNDLDEPLAIHAPQLLTPPEAAYHADLARAETPATPGLEFVIDEIRQRHALSPRTAEPYPPIITELLRHIGDARSATTKVFDYLPQEIGSGDSIPHYDYMARGDMFYHSPDEGPNVHLTLQGEGTVRVGQLRHYSWAETIRRGIAEAKSNGMTPFEINNNLTTAFIEQNGDHRVPEALKEGAARLDEAMCHATPRTSLNPGDAFIFQGHVRNAYLPVVHHFETTSAVPRISAVFRPRFIHTTDVFPASWFFSTFTPYWTHRQRES